MSEALCGPANPLQQFRKQTQNDRTLQQDRLSNRQHPAQGFRSVDPNAGLLDPEFEAFQAGLPPQDFADFHPHRAAAPTFQQQFQPPPAGPSWADDFQRMNLSSAPIQQQQGPAPSATNWAQGFREHIAQNAPRAQSSSPSPYAFQQRARYGMNGFQSNFSQPTLAPAIQSKGKEPVTEQFDEAAFERAFDMAREDMMVEEPAVAPSKDAEEIVQDVETSQEAHGVTKEDVLNMNGMLAQDDRLEDFDFDSFLNQGQSLQEPQQGQDSSQQEQMQEDAVEEQKQHTIEDDDALAATAQELLQKVEHNQSEKFRNSQFLGLMRKLRDREMKVEGDKMVETTSTASTSTADIPLSKPTSSTPLRFNNTEQRPAPLDSRPLDHGIPAHEQDHDPGRDGQDVVNLLNEPGLPGGEPEALPTGTADAGDDIGTSQPSSPFRSSRPCPSAPHEEGPFYADLRAPSQNTSLSDLLYGPDSALSI